MRAIYVIVFSLIIQLCFGQSNEWIVMFHDNHNDSKSPLFIEGAKKIELLSPDLNCYLLKFESELNKEQLTQKLNNFSTHSLSPNLDIEYRNLEPNDFFYNEQWSLDLIQAELAWDQSTGGKDLNGNEIVIAILDDGYDLLHEDLIENYWINPIELPNDGIDNDDNGYIDDFQGVNIQNGSGIHAGVKHGTQVAGIIAAKTDNLMGIAGLSFDSKILLVSGVSNIAEVIKGMQYIHDLKKLYIETNGISGANVVVNNFSGGLKRLFPEDFPSWCEVYDLLGSVGVLSVGAVANENYDVEIEGDLPTLCSSDYLIMVTNTNISDDKVLDAAYGQSSVDLGAPGENIISASIGNDYESISGTSASAPHVAGAVGLLYALPCQTIADENPSQAALHIKEAILNGTDSRSTLSRTVSGGRLNIFNSMLALRNTCGTPAAGTLSFDIYPNSFLSSAKPEKLNIQYQTDLIERHFIAIYSTEGRLIYSGSFAPPVFDNGQYTIDISGLVFARGVYALHISNSKEQKASLIVIH